MTASWTTPSDVAAKVRRRWDDGSLLRDYAGSRLGAGSAQGDSRPEPIVVPIRGPKPSEIAADLAEVRRWVDLLETGSRSDRCYRLERAGIGGRVIGRNSIPVRAVIDSAEQAWRLLGVTAEVRRFDEILAITADIGPVSRWVLEHPLTAIDRYDVIPRLIAAFGWLDAHRESGRYLREISAPGVDTKFAETHRAALADMLGVSVPRFVWDLGLSSAPNLVRMRVSPELGFRSGLSEIACRDDELARLALAPRRALIVENEITYLSAGVPERGVVIWGRGFAVDAVGRLPWLTACDVDYWGDLDTHGFAILDRLRAWLPQVRSVLMDTDTLLSHHDRWVTEAKPTSAVLPRLTSAERDVYTGLVEDKFGSKVRLEQERIDWAWAIARLPH